MLRRNRIFGLRRGIVVLSLLLIAVVAPLTMQGSVAQDANCSGELTPGRDIDPARGEFAVSVPPIPEDGGTEEGPFTILRFLVVLPEDEPLSECFVDPVIISWDSGIVEVTVDIGEVTRLPGGCSGPNQEEGCTEEIFTPESGPFPLENGQGLRFQDAGITITFLEAGQLGGGELKMAPAPLSHGGSHGYVSSTTGSYGSSYLCDSGRCHR